jgi:hypothetical protein
MRRFEAIFDRLGPHEAFQDGAARRWGDAAPGEFPVISAIFIDTPYRWPVPPALPRRWQRLAGLLQ